jgi:hypothetical protein
MQSGRAGKTAWPGDRVSGEITYRNAPPPGDRSFSLLFISASAPSPSTRSILNDMHPILSVLAPERIATEAFTDATAAVTRLKQIYERNTRFLRDRFEAFAKGETPIMCSPTAMYGRTTCSTRNYRCGFRSRP